MIKKCINKDFIRDGFAIIFQVIFIFTFLTLFFFLYVVKIEKEQFKSQINLIVDEIIKDNISGNINNIIPINEEALSLVLYGILDTNEKKIIKNSQKTINDINEKNNKLKKKTFSILYIILGILISGSLLLIILKFCIPILYQIKEALWVVLFVALTEFIFLNFIASKYISADPYEIKRVLAQTVKEKIKKFK